MSDEKEDFVEALSAFLRAELRNRQEPADYCNDAIEIVDARNHLFRNAGLQPTDEEMGRYALRSLCRIDEESLELVPDEMRLRAVARNFFGN